MDKKVEKLDSRLEELNEEYSKTKYNKATNLHLGILRAKIAKVKREIVTAKKRRHGKGFFVKKTGDATVALAGFPSTGKSSLINVMSNTKSKTAQYAFTTLTIVPGVMLYRDAHIQIFDMPGIIEGAHLGVGGGREVISAMRTADLLVFVVDVESAGTLKVLINELKQLNIYVNKPEPQIKIVGMDQGGVKIDVNMSKLPSDYIKEIFSGLGMHNCHVQINEDISEEELIAFAAEKAQYVKAIAALNKIDLNENYEKIAELLEKENRIEVIPISAKEMINLDRLKDAIYNNLGIMTIRLAPKGGAKSGKPMIVRKGSRVGDVAKKLHTEIVDELKCAQIVGKSAKFPNQKVGVTHVLNDGDIITFIKNK
ncbi:GTP-binding protein [Candidatus Marsarchaeota archaeon]|nr:GTP-binding protein [Candidatus Marsarchaeota archaeon]